MKLCRARGLRNPKVVMWKLAMLLNQGQARRLRLERLGAPQALVALVQSFCGDRRRVFGFGSLVGGLASLLATTGGLDHEHMVVNSGIRYGPPGLVDELRG